ncbi:SMP-30/Gluconolaconase/LRE-like region-domain-containing protein [Xylaria sp. FL1777]|nr:SMP-30/Gluconolaconase/LRE-like region-domain-containing protein [Xylaria sp. FL1777]
MKWPQSSMGMSGRPTVKPCIRVIHRKGRSISTYPKLHIVPKSSVLKPLESDYDIKNGTAKTKRLFVKLKGGRMPDGLAIDVKGHILAAANSQGKLVRISPEGEVTATRVVPGTEMTSCPAFGDKDMKTLFITSIAADGSTDHAYRARMDIPGVHRNKFKL